MRLKVGDTSPRLDFDLNGDTTGATSVTLRMWNASTHIVKIAAGTITMDTPASGLGHYDWQTADVDTAGYYQAEVRVVYSTGKIQRFPGKGYLEVVIEEAVA